MSTVISKDGTTIGYDISGSGPALILVDGAMCFRGFGPMTPLSAYLTPHFTVIKYDRRGRGESGDSQPYAIEREVEDLAALVKAAGGSAYVYGISSGAALALRATAAIPGLTKLAIYEPPLVLDNSRPPIPDDYLTQFRQMQTEGRRGDMVEYFMTAGVGMPKEVVTPMRQMPMWPALEAVAPTLIYDTMVMGDFTLSPSDLGQVVASVRVPTLVMGGGASPQSLQTPVKAVSAAVPGAQSKMLAGQTHEVAPDVIAPELIAFFQS